MRTIDKGEFTTFIFSSSLTIALATLQMLIRSPSLLLAQVQTSLARQCYNLGMTQPFDPFVKVIRYHPTQMTSEPIKQQHSQSEMTKRLDKLEGQ